MREIEFRGKTISLPHDWVYGGLVHITQKDGREVDLYYIADTEPNEEFTHKYIVEQVQPETVGQYTGLRDRLGLKIYEGDILEIPFDFGTGNPEDRGVARYAVKWSNYNGGWMLRERENVEDVLDQDAAKASHIVGNIVDGVHEEDSHEPV